MDINLRAVWKVTTKAKIIILLSIVLLIGVLLVLEANINGQFPQKNTVPTLTIGTYTLHVEVARTQAQQERGLSGRTSIALNTGMYFPLSQNTVSPDFWMKDMKIPIDILWLKNDHIIGINANVQPPSPKTPDSALPLIHPPTSSVEGVLEIGANQANNHHLAIGQAVTGLTSSE